MAVRLGIAAELRNAATAEFLSGRDGRIWFFEVKTRLHVGHAVTDLVAGLGIVQEQFRLAGGALLSARALAAANGAVADRSVCPTSHAIELRTSA